MTEQQQKLKENRSSKTFKYEGEFLKAEISTHYASHNNVRDYEHEELKVSIEELEVFKEMISLQVAQSYLASGINHIEAPVASKEIKFDANQYINFITDTLCSKMKLKKKKAFKKKLEKLIKSHIKL